MKRNLNLSIELETYQKVKNIVPERKISLLVDKLLKEHFKKKEREELITGYKTIAKSKMAQGEYEVWEGSVKEGMDEIE